MSLDLQNKVVQFVLNDMSQIFYKMVEAKEQYIKIHSTKKWNYFASITLQNLFSAHDNLPICNISKKMVVCVVKTNMIANIQVVYMSYPVFIQKTSFKDKSERSMKYTFYEKQCFPYKEC